MFLALYKEIHISKAKTCKTCVVNQLLFADFSLFLQFNDIAVRLLSIYVIA